MCIIFEGMDAIFKESIKEKSSEVVARVFTAEADKHIICSDDRMRRRRRRAVLDDGLRSHCKSCEVSKEVKDKLIYILHVNVKKKKSWREKSRPIRQRIIIHSFINS